MSVSGFRPVAPAELFRKEYRLIEYNKDGKLVVQKIGKPMGKKEFEQIKREFEAIGGIIDTSEEAVRHLLNRNAEGSTFDGYTIALMPRPSRVSVFEELIHARHYREGLITSEGDKFRSEVWAKTELLREAKRYKLTPFEIRQTRAILEGDLKRLRDFEEGR